MKQSMVFKLALSNIIIWELKKEVIIVKCLAKILSYKVATKVATLSREHSILFPDVSSGYRCESNIWVLALIYGTHTQS